MKSGKNSAASIRQRLLNIAREQRTEFQLILTRFALERFLYRLSQLEYSSNFILKGAMLFQVWSGSSHRPTRDLDLLSFGDPSIAYFTETIRQICKQEFSEDGIIFHSDSIELVNIKEEDEYQGIRAMFIATLDSARIPIQIDIGFGDSLIPSPLQIDYPTILDLPSPRLRAYAKETVIAEKFHAMVHRGIANTRMKDFYDIWVLATTFSFDFSTLRESLKATFRQRKTDMPIATPLALTTEFSEDSTKIGQWSGFLKKSKLLDAQVITLDDVVRVIGALLTPVLFLSEEDGQESKWDPKKLIWDE